MGEVIRGVNTDNAVSQQVLEYCADRDPIICACAWDIWLLATRASTDIIIKHKLGKELVLADMLSRMQGLNASSGNP